MTGSDHFPVLVYVTDLISNSKIWNKEINRQTNYTLTFDVNRAYDIYFLIEELFDVKKLSEDIDQIYNMLILTIDDVSSSLEMKKLIKITSFHIKINNGLIKNV